MNNNIRIAKELVRLAKSLVANEENILSFEEIQDKASEVIQKIIGNDENLMDADSIMGNRSYMTEKEEYNNEGYVSYSILDNTWEKQTNDLLSIQMLFRKNGLVDIQAYTFGDGIEIGDSHNDLNESQLYSVVDEILKDWRKELPSVYANRH